MKDREGWSPRLKPRQDALLYSTQRTREQEILLISHSFFLFFLRTYELKHKKKQSEEKQRASHTHKPGGGVSTDTHTGAQQTVRYPPTNEITPAHNDAHSKRNNIAAPSYLSVFASASNERTHRHTRFPITRNCSYLFLAPPPPSRPLLWLLDPVGALERCDRP